MECQTFRLQIRADTFVGPDLGPNHLQRFNISRRQKKVATAMIYSIQEPSITNHQEQIHESGTVQILTQQRSQKLSHSDVER